jgi:hypothetical protein
LNIQGGVAHTSASCLCGDCVLPTRFHLRRSSAKARSFYPTHSHRTRMSRLIASSNSLCPPGRAMR